MAMNLSLGLGIGNGAAAGSVTPATQRTVVGIGSGFTSSAASTDYFMPFGGEGLANTTAALASFPWRGTGTFRRLYVVVSANSRTTNTTIVIQKGGSDQLLTATIPGSSGATTVTDLSNSFDVADGDTIGVKVSTGTGAGTVTIRSITCQFERQGQIFTHFCMFNATQFINGARYFTPGGQDNPTSTENDARWKALEACTLTRLFATFSSATTVGGTDVYLRKNNADSAGGNNVNVPSGTVTLVEAGSGSTDSLAIDDTFNILKKATTSNVTLSTAGVRYEGAVAGRTMIGSGGLATATASVTTYGGMFGPPLVGTTESQAKQKMPFNCTISALCANVQANASTVPVTLTLRIDGVDQTMTCNLGTTAGLKTASVQSPISVTAGQDVSVSVTGHDGNVSLSWVGMLVTDAS